MRYSCKLYFKKISRGRTRESQESISGNRLAARAAAAQEAVAPGRRRLRGPDGAAPLRPRRGRGRGEGHLLRRGGLRVDAGLRRRGLPGAAAG